MVCLWQKIIATDAQKHRKNTTQLSVLQCFCGKLILPQAESIQHSCLLVQFVAYIYLSSTNLLMQIIQQILFIALTAFAIWLFAKNIGIIRRNIFLGKAVRAIKSICCMICISGFVLLR